jgi:PAS domain S-box-containing protein
MNEHPIHILYLDPEPTRASSVSEALARTDDRFDVRTVEAVDSARELLASTRVDCLVAREELPGTRGVSFLEGVADRYPRLTTILYSDDHSPSLVRRVSDSKITAFVPNADASRAEERGRHHAEELGRQILSHVDAGADEPAGRSPDFERLAQITSDAIVTIDEGGVIRFANPAVESVLGYSPDELEGEPLTALMSEETAERHERALTRYLRTGEAGLDWDEVDLVGRHEDGRDVPLGIAFDEFGDGDGRYFTGVIRDASADRRRAERLARLNETSRALMGAKSVDRVASLATEAAADVVDAPLASVELYDERTGRLAPVSRSSSDGFGRDDEPLFGPDDGVTWDVYVGNAGRTFDDVLEETELAESDTPLRSAVVLPIGTYGVFVGGAPESNSFDDDDVMFAHAMVANVHAALERADREQTLRTRTEELEEQTTSLRRVNRLNEVIRGLTRTLTEAATRDEIEQAVCTQMANAEPYRFVWIGEQETVGGALVPRASAGIERGYLDEVTITGDDSPTGQGPAGRAVRTQKPQVQNDLRADPPFEPWRSEALRRGYRASISIPIAYKKSTYGVLNLYAGERGVFDDLEVNVLVELGGMIGFAINALERKKALVGDQAVELEFSIADRSVPALEFTARTGSEFEFDALVEQSDGSLRAFFSLSNADPDAVNEYVARTPTVSNVNYLSERDGSYLFEATVDPEGFLGTLLEYGAHPTRLTASDEGGTLTVELPRSGDIRAFLDMFLNTYEGAKLVARRELDRPVQTEKEFQAVYRDRLTARQEEVLRTAYFAGYFDWPRQTTGSEVAELLDVSQPTVARHIRRGEHELFDIVFGRPEAVDEST